MAQGGTPAVVGRVLVEIESLYARSPERYGTGIVVSAGGEVVTNDHVVRGARSIIAAAAGGRRYRVTVVGSDRSPDVAVLMLEAASGMSPARFGDSSQLRIGQSVSAVGYPVAAHRRLVSSDGRVEALERTVVVTDPLSGSREQLAGLVQVSATVRPGVSGGALVDGAGRVVGMATAGTRGTSGGYAIPSDHLLEIMKRITPHRAGPAPVVASSRWTQSLRQLAPWLLP